MSFIALSFEVTYGFLPEYLFQWFLLLGQHVTPIYQTLSIGCDFQWRCITYLLFQLMDGAGGWKVGKCELLDLDGRRDDIEVNFSLLAQAHRGLWLIDHTFTTLMENVMNKWKECVHSGIPGGRR